MEVNRPKRKLIICDIDGTILVNDIPFKGAVETVNMLSQKHDLVLITNNTTTSQQQILSKLFTARF
jgi:ribonucleotide monophosphatase NagD (HAD superfamily)